MTTDTGDRQAGRVWEMSMIIIGDIFVQGKDAREEFYGNLKLVQRIIWCKFRVYEQNFRKLCPLAHVNERTVYV